MVLQFFLREQNMTRNIQSQWWPDSVKIEVSETSVIYTLHLSKCGKC